MDEKYHFSSETARIITLWRKKGPFGRDIAVALLEQLWHRSSTINMR
jgi:hypothetical protein